MRILVLALLAWLVVLPLAAGENAPAKQDEPQPEAERWVLEHEMRSGGRTLRYQATAGIWLMRDDEDEPVALFGSTAYLAQGVDPTARPLRFAYNGGPGSASIWLHRGVLGPQRAVVTDAGFTAGALDRRVASEREYVVFGAQFQQWDWSHRQPDVQGCAPTCAPSSMRPGT